MKLSCKLESVRRSLLHAYPSSPPLCHCRNYCFHFFVAVVISSRQFEADTPSANNAISLGTQYICPDLDVKPTRISLS